jgi:Transcriptional regulator PadR-like family
MIEELGRHGYKVSAGTLYPILHGLEEKGYLASTEERTGRAARRISRHACRHPGTRRRQAQGARTFRRAVRGRGSPVTFDLKITSREVLR